MFRLTGLYYATSFLLRFLQLGRVIGYFRSLGITQVESASLKKLCQWCQQTACTTGEKFGANFVYTFSLIRDQMSKMLLRFTGVDCDMLLEGLYGRHS